MKLEKILKTKLIQRGASTVKKALVQWTSLPDHMVIGKMEWKVFARLAAKYQLEDRLVLKEEGMLWKTLTRPVWPIGEALCPFGTVTTW